jgi:uncharacterized protein YbjT (DUF2867 family)
MAAARTKVLVIGLSGHIGPAVVKSLCRSHLSSVTVVGATRNVSGGCAVDLLSSVSGAGVELIRADMSIPDSLAEALADVRSTYT